MCINAEKPRFLLVPTPFGGISDCPKSYLPLGLLSVATVLHNAGIETEIVDINALASDFTFSNVAEDIMARQPDIIGFSTVGAYYHLTIDMARRCKELIPKTTIIFGGPQATLTDEATVTAFPFVDVVVRGEAERSIIPLYEAISGKRDLMEVPGVTFFSHGQVIRTPDVPLIEDLDLLPDPSYELFPSINNLEIIYVEDGRGCPYRCSFCCTNVFWHKRFRTRSVERVVHLLKKLAFQYGNNKRFVFIQDTPFLSEKRIIQLCEAIKRENLDIRWRCYSRIDHLDETIVHKMADAGCDNIFFGIESGSQRMQKIIGKKLDLSNTINTTRLAFKQGPSYTVSFITGFPDETVEDLESTINLAMALKYDCGKCRDIQLHRLAPLPGSRIYEEYQDKLLLDYSFWGPWNSNCMSDKQLEMIKKYPRIFSSFYYCPTKHYSRKFWLQIHFLIGNLLRMDYAGFILHKDKRLEFPACVSKYHSLVVLPHDYEKKYGRYESLVQVARFFKKVLKQIDLQDHYLCDVMDYELAVTKVRESTDEKPFMVENFEYDVEQIIHSVEINEFHRLPKVVNRKHHTLLFTKNQEKLVTVEIPEALASMFTR